MDEENVPTRHPLFDTLHRSSVSPAREVPCQPVACSIPLPLLRVGTKDRTREPTMVPDQAAGNSGRTPAL